MEICKEKYVRRNLKVRDNDQIPVITSAHRILHYTCVNIAKITYRYSLNKALSSVEVFTVSYSEMLKKWFWNVWAGHILVLF